VDVRSVSLTHAAVMSNASSQPGSPVAVSHV